MIQTKNIRLSIITFLFLLGFGLSAHLTQTFYDVRNGSSSFHSLCNISEKMNCDQVAASRYAEFIFGIPLSTLAAGWFVGLFLISLLLYLPEWKKEGTRFLCIFSFLGLMIGLPYVFIMTFQIKTFCLFCILIDGIHLSTFLLTLFMRPGTFNSLKPHFKQLKIFLIILGASIFLTIIGFKGFDRSQLSLQDSKVISQAILNRPPQSLNIIQPLPTLGSPLAKITIVEVSDFECPHCKLGALILKKVLDRYPNDVKIIFRNFPLDSTCNSAMPARGHQFACEAAKIAICSQKMGKFETIYEALFENQENFHKNSPTQIALQKGLNENELKVCIESPETLAALEMDVQFGIQQEVQATPTFWIQGHQVEGPYPFQVWSDIIDSLL